MTVPVSADRLRTPRPLPQAWAIGGRRRFFSGRGGGQGGGAAPEPASQTRLFQPLPGQRTRTGGGVLAPRGAPRHGWVGQGVFGSLLRASGTSGPGGVRAFSLSPTRVVRPTEKRALSLLRSPWPGQLRRMKGGKVSTVPQKTP